eukprot:COSAG05_NODE_22990_length_261_cov_0.623457_1_plen_22_part_10
MVLQSSIAVRAITAINWPIFGD